MATSGDLRIGAAVWLAAAQETSERFSLAVGELRAAAAAEGVPSIPWLRSAMQALLEISRGMEAPPPHLQACLDWPRWDTVLQRHYEELEEGQALNVVLEARYFDGEDDFTNDAENEATVAGSYVNNNPGEANNHIAVGKDASVVGSYVNNNPKNDATVAGSYVNNNPGEASNHIAVGNDASTAGSYVNNNPGQASNHIADDHNYNTDNYADVGDRNFNITHDNNNNDNDINEGDNNDIKFGVVHTVRNRGKGGPISRLCVPGNDDVLDGENNNNSNILRDINISGDDCSNNNNTDKHHDTSDEGELRACVRDRQDASNGGANIEFKGGMTVAVFGKGELVGGGSSLGRFMMIGGSSIAGYDMPLLSWDQGGVGGKGCRVG
ncbi:hypothetical protein CBR_g587 [Chara braunii]|uniref:Uncharacterized protein n=1 Tax=Chara braunii TaxID=69332 RepID=A0A388KBL0_CHABU|nr:hypothetical protein CBR_g587 [Chara braunii]|eukprot:GBG67452.1 hypothetical protein CBR_g587 [Chara braunii]